MSDFWIFAQESPVTAFFIVLIVCYAATRPFRYMMVAYNRKKRAENIARHGWPKPPMDADGDIVHPEKSS